MMPITKVLDAISKPVLLVLMALGFIFFWPIGLVIFCWMAWSGQFGSFRMPSWGGSGNKAFDERRAEILAQLEAEREAFAKFIEELKASKDKSEFDAFMAKFKR